jgi:hypothetical protein
MSNYFQKGIDNVFDKGHYPSRRTERREPMNNATRIANMIRANVAAVDDGRITWEQFGIVNRATWELADRNEPCIIGSACSRRVAAVHRALNEMPA